MGLLERTGYLNNSPESTMERQENREALKDRIKKALGKDESMTTSAVAGWGRDEARRKIISKIQEEGMVLSRGTLMSLVEELEDEIFGLGSLEELLRDPDITEIMVNGPRAVFMEKNSRITAVPISFRDDAEVLHLIDRITGPLNLRLDESSPMLDARLPDGSRINAIIPPICLNGPTLTIRKFSREVLSPEDLVEMGTFTCELAEYFRACVESRKNIIISGGTSSGKTTLLNALSCFIPSHERLITIEDAAELKLHQPHVISLESRPPNLEGKGEVTTRDLVRNSLRMRPDRIIVGEVRGAECLDMLQAMNTGHEGSLSTAHANSAEDLMPRLETMAPMSNLTLSPEAVRRQIASALDLVVHMSRTQEGRRRVAGVKKMVGLQNGVIELQTPPELDGCLSTTPP